MARDERDEWVEAASTKDIREYLVDYLLRGGTRRSFLAGAAKLGLTNSMAIGLLAACENSPAARAAIAETTSKTLENLPLEIAQAYRPISGKKVAYLTASFANDFGQVQDSYFKAYAARVGWEYKAFDGALNTEQTNKIANQLIDQGYSAILFDPQDAAGNSPIVARAKSKGVIWVNTNDWTLEYPTFACMADFYQHGVAAADWIMKRRPGPKVISIVGSQSARGIGRQTGALDTFQKGGATFLLASAEGGWSKQTTHDLFAGILQRFPKIDGVWAGSDEQGLGCSLAAVEGGRRREIVIVGCGGLKTAQVAIRSGELDASIGQNLEVQCNVAAGVIEGLLRVGLDGNRVHGMYNAPVYCIDRSNVDQVWQAPF